MPTSHEFTFPSGNGKNQIFVRECVPDGACRGVVQIAHGIAEHSERYLPFMNFLAAHGFAAVANDHLGHGKTAAGRQELCFFAKKDGWSLAVEDLDCLHRIEVEKHPGVPYFLFGHSMGSFLSRSYIIVHPDGLAGTILSGTGQNPAPVIAAGKLVARLEILDNGPAYPSPLLDKLAFGSYNKGFESPRTKFDWLSRDPAVVDAYSADPLCGMPASAALFRDMMGGLQFNWKAENLRRMNRAMPVFFLSGDRDPVGENGRAVKKVAQRFRDVGMQDVKLTLYPGGRHEMLNELNRDEVMANILAWLESNL